MEGSYLRDSASHRISDELSSWHLGGDSFSSSDAQGHVKSKIDGSHAVHISLIDYGHGSLNRR
eukprot:CAMPEP_0171923788 /NCGR_PEP_ID=MMETSP0993-20121228/22461_1 /TAXON_ID=483369 /ORGANISM="non described non described, Strain CCMP2098" /LENGTH=62 /DNA_ID=CAMNT_0012561901 /DNA_START=182 /DNA_END=367 /DNA_ORIENTATION=-